MDNNKGFTLIEIIITMAILLIISIPICNMFLFSTKLNSFGKDQMKAVSIAKKYIEEIKAVDDISYINCKGPIEYEGYKLNVSIEGVEDYTNDEAKENEKSLIQVNIDIEGQYHIEYSWDEDKHHTLTSPVINIVYDNNKDFYINGKKLFENFEDKINIVVNFNYEDGNYVFNINNKSKDKLFFYFFESEFSGDYEFNLLKGQVDIHKKEKCPDKDTDFDLYKITVDILKGSKHITTFVGTKRNS